MTDLFSESASPVSIKITQEDLPHVYDDAFTVKARRWGTFVSQDLQGADLVTSSSDDGCIAATRWYLKARQEGFTEEATRYDGTVESKL
jgi:hypothetical protein